MISVIRNHKIIYKEYRGRGDMIRDLEVARQVEVWQPPDENLHFSEDTRDAVDRDVRIIAM